MKINIIIIPVSAQNSDVQDMIRRLDNFQVHLYGRENCNLESAQSLERNGAFLLGAYMDNRLVGIGGVKILTDYAEIKRMFIAETHRGRNLGKDILMALENHVRDNDGSVICLETGNRQQAAIKFYQKLGYIRVEKFGDYQPNAVSIYLSKQL